VTDIASAVEPLRLKLLGGFTLLRGREEIALPTSAQRVVALLALRDRPLSRGHLARVLWPDCPAERSLADLRTALWRVNQARTRSSAAPACACGCSTRSPSTSAR
jgi:DNA-binding SARP family transcriptional activator